jgi:hypothetical protein
MEMIAGIPKDELDALNAKTTKMKLAAYQLALDIARMSPEQRKMTGYMDAGQVLILEAKAIEKLIVALERKYPSR